MVIAWVGKLQQVFPLPLRLHAILAIILGISVLFLTGFALAAVWRRPGKPGRPGDGGVERQG